MLRIATLFALALLCASCSGDCPPGSTLFKGRDKLVGRHVQACARNGSLGRHGAYREFYDDSGKHLAKEGSYRDDVPIGLFQSYDARGKLASVQCFDDRGTRLWRDDKPADNKAGGRPCR